MTELNNHRENDESDANLKTKGDLGDLCQDVEMQEDNVDSEELKRRNELKQI